MGGKRQPVSVVEGIRVGQRPAWERRLRLARLHRDGWTLEAIAESEGITRKRAQKVVSEGERFIVRFGLR